MREATSQGVWGELGRFQLSGPVGTVGLGGKILVQRRTPYLLFFNKTQPNLSNSVFLTLYQRCSNSKLLLPYFQNPLHLPQQSKRDLLGKRGFWVGYIGGEIQEKPQKTTLNYCFPTFRTPSPYPNNLSGTCWEKLGFGWGKQLVKCMKNKNHNTNCHKIKLFTSAVA